jgi:hypothetical protein
MAKKIKPINYTSRDFSSIKEDLVDYAKRYYPDSFKDFNEASFGSLMLDTVSYVGDILSFYLDYQTNESFLNRATEPQNIINLSRQLGYKFRNTFTSTGEVTVYALIPNYMAHPGPDTAYYPVIKEGTTFTAAGGGSFILAEDIRFDSTNTEIVVGRVDESTGEPTYFAVKNTGKIISGQIVEERFNINEFIRFRKLFLDNADVVEVLSIFDSDGNEYYEVENLSQNVIYKNISKTSDSEFDYKQTLRPIVAPRRFVHDYDGQRHFIQFGYGSEDEILENPVADPSSVTLQLEGKDYTTEKSFDPMKLLETDKLGISPSNTIITVRMRINTSSNVNAPAGSIRKIDSLVLDFEDVTILDSTKLNFVRGSIQAYNEEPIVGDAAGITAEELKIRAMNTFSAQNRAVTAADYEHLTYAMPAKFGSIKRCKIVVDDDSFKRNLNLYVLSENKNLKLTQANSQLKENLRFWLSQRKMINDTVDIIDGKIINIGIDFEVISDKNSNKEEVYRACIARIINKINNPLQMGERFYITDLYSELNKVRGVVDTVNVTVNNKVGGTYSGVSYSIDTNLSPDGRYLVCPLNACFEIKFPEVDIKGVVR